MKKYTIAFLLLVASLSLAAQSTQERLGFYSDGRPGKKFIDTIHLLSNLPLTYFNGFGNFVSLPDSIGPLFSVTNIGSSGASTYNPLTRVFNIPIYSGGGVSTAVDSIWRTPGQDSIKFSIAGRLRSIKDSTGGGGAAGWALTGNAATSPGTNFLGTTDAQNLLIKTNGIIRASYGSDGKSFIDSLYIGRGTGTGRLLNIAIGDSALYSATTANYNTAVGVFAMKRTLDGSRNAAFGDSALRSNTSGNDNMAIGFGSLRTNTTGSQNVAVGTSALAANTSSQYNTAVGFETLKAQVGGTLTYNTAIGALALTANTTGVNNTAVGYSSLLSVNSSYNSAFGFNNLKLATGNYNSGFGAEALQAVTSGSKNTAIGEAAFYQLTQGNDNTRVGAEFTGTTGVTTGSGNTIIGANVALVGATALTNTLILAAGAGTQNQRIYSNSTGQTGMLYTSPSAMVHIGPGNAAAGRAPLKLTYIQLATTAATGTGATATLTFAAQAQPPFAVGSTILVAGVTPSGYNASAGVVTACTTTTVSYTNTGTGAQTVAGTITVGVLLATPESGAIETDGVHIYWTDATGTRRQLDN